MCYLECKVLTDYALSCRLAVIYDFVNKRNTYRCSKQGMKKLRSRTTLSLYFVLIFLFNLLLWENPGDTA